MEIQLCTNIIKFLFYICEGTKRQNKEIKLFFRKQNSFDKRNVLRENVNFVSLFCELFGSFAKFYNNKTVELGIWLLTYLNEIIKGPILENQIECNDTNVHMYCKDLLTVLSNVTGELQTRGFVNGNNASNNELFTKMIEFVISLLEGLPNYHPVQLDTNEVVFVDKRSEVLVKTAYFADFKFLLKKISLIFENFVQQKIPMFEKNYEDVYKHDVERLYKKMKEAIFDDEIMLGFKVYFLLKKLCDHKKDVCEEIQKVLKIVNLNNPDSLVYMRGNTQKYEWFKLQYAWLFYYYNSQAVEVKIEIENEISNSFCQNYSEQVQQKHYFPVHPACNYLPEKEKRRLEYSISRESETEKKLDIIKQKDEIIYIIDHIFKLKVLCKLDYNSPDEIRKFLLIISFMYNVFYLLFAEKKIVRTKSENESQEAVNIVLYILGLCHFVTSCMLVLFQSLVTTKMILDKNWETLFNEFYLAIGKSSLKNENRLFKEVCVSDYNFKELKHQDRIDLIIDYQVSQGSAFPMP